MRPTPRAVVTRGELQAGDLIVFATDALAQRLLAEVESGSPPDWGRFWDLDQETWRREIEAIRDQNGIVNDDCTLLVLRPPGRVAVEPIATEPDPGRRSRCAGRRRAGWTPASMIPRASRTHRPEVRHDRSSTRPDGGCRHHRS